MIRRSFDSDALPAALTLTLSSLKRSLKSLIVEDSCSKVKSVMRGSWA